MFIDKPGMEADSAPSLVMATPLVTCAFSGLLHGKLADAGGICTQPPASVALYVVMVSPPLPLLDNDGTGSAEEEMETAMSEPQRFTTMTSVPAAPENAAA